MKKWLLYTVMGIVSLVLAATAIAQSYKISVSQFVEHPALDAVLQGFQDDLAEYGLQAEYLVHNAQANMATANQIGHQIMGEAPDLILAIATPSAQACAQALQKAPHMQQTPMLFSAVTDPVAAGLVSNPDQPGANITGVSDLLPVAQHMAMVRTFYPDLKRLGVMYNAGETNSKVIVELIRQDAAQNGYTVVDATVAKSSDAYQAAQSLVGQVEAIYIPTDNTVVAALEAVIKVCTQSKLPLFNADVDSVARGSVAALGFDYYQHGRQTGAMARRILSGTPPSEIEVETQQSLQLHLNLTAARNMGVSVPPELRSAADKIYE